MVRNEERAGHELQAQDAARERALEQERQRVLEKERLAEREPSLQNCASARLSKGRSPPHLSGCPVCYCLCGSALLSIHGSGFLFRLLII